MSPHPCSSFGPARAICHHRIHYKELTRAVLGAGHIMEIPLSYLVPRVGGILLTAGLLWWANPYLFWNKKPDTYSPEFLAEQKKIGNVAVCGLQLGLEDAVLAWR